MPLPDGRWRGVYLTLGTWKGWCCHPHLRLAPSGPDGHQGEREHPWDLKEAGTDNKDVHTASDLGEGDLCRVVSVVSPALGYCRWLIQGAHARCTCGAHLSVRRWRVSPGQVLTPRAIPQPPGATLPSLASLLLSLGYFSRAKLSEQTLQTVGLYPMCDNPLAIH